MANGKHSVLMRAFLLLVVIVCVCVCARVLLSHVQLFVTPWTVAHQAPLSMRFPRQEYWSGLPCPTRGDLPNPGIEPTSPEAPVLAGRFLTTEPSKEAPSFWIVGFYKISGNRISKY